MKRATHQLLTERSADAKLKIALCTEPERLELSLINITISLQLQSHPQHLNMAGKKHQANHWFHTITPKTLNRVLIALWTFWPKRSLWGALICHLNNINTAWYSKYNVSPCVDWFNNLSVCVCCYWYTLCYCIIMIVIVHVWHWLMSSDKSRLNSSHKQASATVKHEWLNGNPCTCKTVLWS